MSDEQNGDTVSLGADDEAALNARAEAAQQLAGEVVALDVTDLAEYLPGLDLFTLRFVLLAEESKGKKARAEAIAAIQAAIDTHPDQIAAIAAEPEPSNEASVTEPEPDGDAEEADAPTGPTNEELADGTALMAHHDGGDTDAYERDGNGNFIVPFADVETMLSHGFVILAIAAA